MKKLYALLLMSFVVMEVTAQNVVFSNLKDLLAHDGDTIAVLNIEKRNKNQLLMTGGADYKISSGNNNSACRYLKSRCYAVQADTSLYVNCKKLRYKKFRFGSWYAPALRLGNQIYFSAVPLGSVAAGSDATMDVMLGGSFGDAIAASALVSKRVYYVINPETGKVDFVGKDKMLLLLADYPDWKKAYLDANSESAKVTRKYLLLLNGERK